MINTNELMTGDIVAVKKPNTPFRVTKILGSYGVGGYILHRDKEHEYMELSNDEIYPITITPKIIKLNGWKKINGLIGYWPPIEDCAIGWANTEVRNFSLCGSYDGFRVVHVHHLQNLLRNFGYADHAANKIFLELGMTMTFTDDEHHAYLVGWIAGAIASVAWGKLPKK